VGANVRRFVKLIVRLCPVGTVITTGDQPASAVVLATGAFQIQTWRSWLLKPVATKPQL